MAELVLTGPTVADVAVYPPGATFGPRRMRDFEFVWMIEGDAEYRFDEQTVPAPQEALVLCQPGWVDAFRWDTARHTRHGFFHFGVASVPDHWPARDQWPVVRQLPPDDVIRPLLRHMITWRRTGSAALRRRLAECVLEAFVLGELSCGDVPPMSVPDPVDRAWRYMHQQLEADPASPITLRDLADAACVTPEHLCRVFRRATGRSPLETVLQARLDRAATLLARSNFSIGQIAALCGFSSQFHFSRRFRAAYGKSPTELRAAIQQGAVPPAPRLLRRLRG